MTSCNVPIANTACVRGCCMIQKKNEERIVNNEQNGQTAPYISTGSMTEGDFWSVQKAIICRAARNLR